MQEKIDFMKQYSFFSEWSTSKMLSLWELFKKITYPKNYLVYKEGDLSDGIYFVRKGEIEVIMFYRN
jgi:CRP-like cAMP-binding protein